MASYMVITKLTDKDGVHEVGDIIDIEPQNSEERVALGKLIDYGILTQAPQAEKKTAKSTGSK